MKSQLNLKSLVFMFISKTKYSTFNMKDFFFPVFEKIE